MSAEVLIFRRRPFGDDPRAHARARAELAAAFGLPPHGLDALLMAPPAVREPILAQIYAKAESVLAEAGAQAVATGEGSQQP